MNEFNLNPEYKKYRQNKKKRAARIHRIKIAAAVVGLSLAIVGLVIFLIVNSNNNNDTSLPTAQPTPSATPATTVPSPEANVPTIFIHPGHGALLESGTPDLGIGNGSAYFEESRGKTESDLTLEIALKLRSALTDMGYKVVLSREYSVDHTLSDPQVCGLVNTSKADAVISIHGGSGMPTNRGAAIVYSQLNANSAKTQALAESISRAIDAKEGQIHAEKTELSLSDIGLLKDAGVPAIQIDVLNLSNELDARLGVSQAWQEKFSYAVADGIKNAFPIEEP